MVVQRSAGAYLQPGDGSLAATAPCTPPGVALAGWRIASEGPSSKVYPVGTPVTDLFPGAQVDSRRITLAAAWKVTYGVDVSPTALSLTVGGSPVIIVTAQRNGQPAQSASVAVSVTGPLILGNRCTSATLPTSVLGSALVTGRPGIVVEGTATGTARPVIAADGTFTWVRKTGKKANVYVSDASGGAHHGRCDRARSSARALRTRRVKAIYPRLGTLRVTWCPDARPTAITPAQGSCRRAP